MTDQEHADRALAALDAMADEWIEETLTHGLASNAVRAISGGKLPPALNKRATDHIVALIHMAFVEGAYRCYLDAKDGKIPWLQVVN